MMNNVLSSRVLKMWRSRDSRSQTSTSWWFTQMRPSSATSTTIESTAGCVGALTSRGTLTSSPFWVRPSAAMKITRRTSSTSTSGVTFISPVCRVGVRGSSPSRRSLPSPESCAPPLRR